MPTASPRLDPAKVIWEPTDPLPEYADRATMAKIITANYFPISPRTFESWPLRAYRPSRHVVYKVADVVELAKVRIEDGPTYRQSNTRNPK